jgi:CYTH domain-containing protein
MTIRRRFLLASSLARLIQRERGGLRQIEGFFPEQKDRTSWVRLEEDRALLVLRTAGPDGDIEEETEVPAAHGHALLDVCAGEVDYIRTRLPIGDRDALIDHFMRPKGLYFVSVEFQNVEEARGFDPLQWFGPEVTTEARYGNQSLALRGIKQSQDAPLTNAALTALLDTLESRFSVQSRMPVIRPSAKQASVTRAQAGPAQTNGQGVEVNLDEIEAAMMREMERTLQKSEPE